MNRNALLRLSAGAGLATVVRPFEARAQTAPTPIVVGALRSSDMVNLYYNAQQNEFQKAGLDVTIQPMPNGSAALAAVVGGSINIAAANVLSLAQAFQHGIPVRVIAPSGASTPETANGNQILVAGNSAIRTPRDLEGKKIAVTSLHDLMSVAINSWLEQKGVDRSKVSFVELPPSAMYNALEADRVSAMAIFDPFLSSAKESGARVLGQPFDGIAPRFSVTAWFAVDPWPTKNREAVLRFINVLNRSAGYVNTHYDDLIPLIASYSKLPPETLKRMSHPIIVPSLAAAPLQPPLDVSAKYNEISHFNASEMVFPGAK